MNSKRSNTFLGVFAGILGWLMVPVWLSGQNTTNNDKPQPVPKKAPAPKAKPQPKPQPVQRSSQPPQQQKPAQTAGQRPPQNNNNQPTGNQRTQQPKQPQQNANQQPRQKPTQTANQNNNPKPNNGSGQPSNNNSNPKPPKNNSGQANNNNTNPKPPKNNSEQANNNNSNPKPPKNNSGQANNNNNGQKPPKNNAGQQANSNNNQRPRNGSGQQPNQNSSQPGGQRPGQQAPTQTARSFNPPKGAAPAGRQGDATRYSHKDGRQWEVGRGGQVTHYSKPGVDARFRDNGRVATTRVVRKDRSEMVINHGVRGERRVEVVRPDRTRLVSVGRDRGYLERPLGRAGYVSRTYVDHGRSYATVYRTYSYRNMAFYGYVPGYYYQPRFYAWAYDPWAAPIAFSWGWNRDPWFGFYGGYFTPAPVYATASLWLTDYLLAENLRMAYENRDAGDNGAPYAGQPQNFQSAALTPEIKQAIAEEVRQQIEAEQAAANSQPLNANSNSAFNSNSNFSTAGNDAPPPALDPKQRIFVVSMNIDVTAGGQDCALTPGDIIIRTSDTLVDGNKVGVNVLNSKPGDCPVNSAAAIEVATLQEMHNEFRQQIDSGLKTLADNQGKGGLPAGPAASPRAVPEGQASPDRNAQATLSKQYQEADKAEQDALKDLNKGQ